MSNTYDSTACNWTAVSHLCLPFSPNLSKPLLLCACPLDRLLSKLAHSHKYSRLCFERLKPVPMQDSSALLTFCSVWAGRLPSAAQAPPHQSAAVCHWLHLQPCLCHPGGGSDPGRHPQSHLLHAKVPPFIWSDHAPCPLTLLTPAPS